VPLIRTCTPADATASNPGPDGLIRAWLYDTVVHMEEVLTIRVPKGTRRRLERRAKAERLTVSQLVRRALEQDELLASLAAARAELVPQARAQGIYTDEDVFALIS
jgi:predicted transcriptional regulator